MVLIIEVCIHNIRGANNTTSLLSLIIQKYYYNHYNAYAVHPFDANYAIPCGSLHALSFHAICR